jgi:heat shock protein HslJ
MSAFRVAAPTLLILLAGCVAVPPPPASKQPAVAPLQTRSVEAQHAPAEGMQLAGSWRLVTVDGKSAEPDQLVISFRPQSFAARLNCNTVSGRYSLLQQRFVPDMAVATERGCGPQYHNDRALTRALQTGFVITTLENGRLEAHAGKMVMVFTKNRLRRAGALPFNVRCIRLRTQEERPAQ